MTAFVTEAIVRVGDRSEITVIRDERGGVGAVERIEYLFINVGMVGS